MSALEKRFGDSLDDEINTEIENITPVNTKKSRTSIWKQFSEFCREKNYVLSDTTSPAQLNIILKTWAYNMKKKDGTDYKEMVVKNMWNVTAKMLQELYFNKWNVTINPFSDIIFKFARDARDAKRKKLQFQPENKMNSAAALTEIEYANLINVLDEDTPEGLQKKFFIIASYELAWRGGEGAKCLTHYFKEEISNDGSLTGRVEYNPIFTKTAQGGAQKLAESKWLIPNSSNPAFCPVRLYHKFMSKRLCHVKKTERMFLTPNPYWQKSSQCGWYKNCPAGINEVGKWIKTTAEKSGLDVKRAKICNHSMRSTAVSHLAKAGIGEQQVIKITGHSSTNSLKPYMQLDSTHHKHIIEEMRKTTTITNATTHVSERNSTAVASTSGQHQQDQNAAEIKHLLASNCENVTFQNCTFNFNS